MAESAYERYQRLMKSGEQEKETASQRYARLSGTQKDLSSVANDISSRLDEYQKNLQSYVSYYNNRAGKRQPGVYVNDSKDYADLTSRQKAWYDATSRDINSLLDNYGSSLGKDYVDSVKNFLSSNGKLVDQINQTAMSDDQYWSKYTPEQYEKTYDQYIYGQKYRNASSGDLVRAIDDTSTTDREKEWLLSQGYASDNYIAKKRSELQAEIDRLSNDTEAKVSNRLIRPIVNNVPKEQERLNELRAELEQLDAIERSTKKTRQMAGYERKYGLSAEEWAKGVGDNQDVIDYILDNSNFQDFVGTEYGYFTDNELDTYGYLISQGDVETANQFLTDYTPILNQRKNQAMVEAMQAAPAWAKVVLNVLSVPANVIGGIPAGIDSLFQQISGTEYDPFNGAQSLRNFASAVRSVTGQSIDEVDGSGKLSMLYNAGMSALDSLAGGLTLGRVDPLKVMGFNPNGLAKAMTNLYSLSMMGNAGATEAQRLYEKGASASQVFWGGTLAGIAEGLFEYVSLDKLLKDSNPANWMQIVRNVLKQAGVEGSEEVATSIANTLTNAIVMGQRSDISEDVNKMVAGYYDDTGVWHDGVTREEAQKKALLNKVEEIVEDFVTGAISGGLSSAIYGGASGGHNANIGTDINKAGAAPGLIAAGLNTADTKSQTYKTAQRLSKQLEKGKSLTGINARMGLGSLLSTGLETTTEEYTRAQERLLNRAVNSDEIIKTAMKEAGISEENFDSVRTLVIDENTEDSEATDLYNKDEAVRKVVDDLRKENEKISNEALGRSVNVAQYKAVLEDLEESKASTPEQIRENVQSLAEVHIKTKDGKVDEGVVNKIVEGYDAEMQKKMTSNVYARAAVEAYNFGITGQGLDVVARKEHLSSMLSDTLQKQFYDLGVIAQGDEGARQVLNGTQDKAQQGTVVFEKAERGNQSVTDVIKSLEKGDDSDKAQAERINATVEALRKLAGATGIKIHLYASSVRQSKDNTIKRFWVNERGEEVTQNGFYRSGTNEIWVDVNSGRNADSLIMFTVAHELTHLIKNFSPASFRTLAQFLVDEYKGGNKSVDWHVKAMMQEALNNKMTLSYADAFEEFVAESMTDMFSDGQVFEKIVRLAKKDVKLTKKMESELGNIAEKLRKVYAGLRPDSELGKVFEDMKDKFEKLQNMFADAVVAASQAVKGFYIGTADLTKTAEAMNEEGRELFEIRAMIADEDVYRQMLYKWGGMKPSEITALFNMVDKATALILQNTDVLDYAYGKGGDIENVDNRAFNPMKQNSDPLYKVSVDFSTLCRKRILQQTIASRLQDRLNRPITREEGIAIRDALKELKKQGKQVEIACALCYVESARMKSPEQIKRFIENRAQVLHDWFADHDDVTKGRMYDYEQKKRKELGVEPKAPLDSLPKNVADKIRDAKKRAKAEYVMTPKQEEMVRVAENMTVNDITSPAGLSEMKNKYADIFYAYTSFVRNATKSKGIEDDTWWRAGDSASIGDETIANMNAENGLRSQSWSDFQVIHLMDYIASVIELSTRGAKQQVYTKVPDFVYLMGKTNAMINLSLIPTETFNGSLEFDDVEGIVYNEALKLRQLYHGTAGTISIGMNDEQIKLLLASELIDYVIPYHRSSMDKRVRVRIGIPTWEDYERFQQEKKLSRAEAEKRAAARAARGVTLLGEDDPNYHKEIKFSDWFNLEQAKATAKANKGKNVLAGGYAAMREAAERYLDICAERGLAPKFSNSNKGTDFTQEENYWKLLIDRKMVDQVTGEIIEQKALTPVFDEEQVMRILNDELARYGTVKADEKYAIDTVVDMFTSGKITGKSTAKQIADVMQKPVANVAAMSVTDEKYMFRGATPTSDNSNLAEAQEMEKQGKSSEEIRQATGWFKSYDGKWRFEIDDSKASLDIRSFKESIYEQLGKDKQKLKAQYDAGKIGESRYYLKLQYLNDTALADSKLTFLGKILKHPQLFKSYPFLKNVEVEFKALDANHHGGTTTDGSRIVLNEKLSEDQMLDTLLHEIQHVIQDNEKFARGSNLIEAEADKEDELNAKRKKIRDKMYPIRDEINERVDKYINEKFPNDGYYTLYGYQHGKLAQAILDYKNAKTGFGGRTYAEENAAYAYETAKGLEGFDQSIFDEIDKVGEKIQELYDELGKISSDEKAFDRYQRTAGEIEARDTANRRQLTAEQRKETRPDIDRDDAIVKYQARIGTAEDGTPIYESNFPKGTPKAAKSQKILSYIQNVWSKKPITLVISNGDTSRKIEAKFDPYYDTSGNVLSDASKLAGGNRHGTASDQRVTLDLADDYYEIAENSKYNYSKLEEGKESEPHNGVSMWHYFFNDIYFAEYGEEKLTPYTVTVNVKEKVDGDYVYSISAEKKSSTRQTLHADVNTRKGASGELFIDNNYTTTSPESQEISEKNLENSEKNPDKHQERAKSNREILSEALESATQNEIEAKRLAEYKSKVEQADELQAHLSELRDRIFGKADKKGQTVREIQDEIRKTNNRIDIIDKQLLRLEAMAPIQRILNREKAENAKLLKEQVKLAESRTVAEYEERSRELVAKYGDRLKERYSLAEQKAKIKKDIQELDKLFRADKEKRVKQGMLDLASTQFAQTALMLDSAHITNEEIVRAGVTRASEQESKYLNRYMDALEAIETARDTLWSLKTQEANPEVRRRIEGIEQTIRKSEGTVSYLNGKLKELFARERQYYSQATAKGAIEALATAYRNIRNSKYEYIQNAYDEDVAGYIDSLAAEDFIGKSFKDMTSSDLEQIHKAYRMVLTTIKKANNLFRAGKNATVAETSSQVMKELEYVKNRVDYRSQLNKDLNRIGWQFLKPIYAFRMLGSGTLEELYQNVRKGEDTWVVNAQKAKEHIQSLRKKYNYKKWKNSKPIEAESRFGEKFKLTREQAMSLYAYSRRGEQAINHITGKGIVLGEDTEMTVGKRIKRKVTRADTHAYSITTEELNRIINQLTEDERGYVVEAQKYLSEDMAKLGNEVSMLLYGVELFGEKNYFQLRSSGAQMQKEIRDNAPSLAKLKNAGFSQSTIKRANNAVVLSEFDNVWEDHVNEMIMYNAFVPALEDFEKVYGRQNTDTKYGSDNVRTTIDGTWGAGANAYISQLLQDINKGRPADPAAAYSNKLLSLMKKGATFVSASVAIQQGSAVARAMAYVDPKYFVGNPLLLKHNEKWAELKKYAPIAAIKEMGYFDTGMGRSTREWFDSGEYEGLREKIGAFFKDGQYRDELLSRVPSFVDEVGWIQIWEAVKKETKAETNLEGEELLKKAGERFTEVVQLTQVYDSVFSRSGLMRSKDFGMKMVTAFGAESTTQYNMLLDAFVQGKRGNKKFVPKSISALVFSIILNTVLKSIIMAARDKDRDKTYLERYLGAAIEDVADNLNPMTMVPYVKDLVSLVQGYDVERLDVSVFKDVIGGLQTAADDNKSAADRITAAVSAIGQATGVPAKNIIRDVRALVNTFNDARTGNIIRNTTRTGTAVAAEEGFASSFLGTLTNSGIKLFKGTTFDDDYSNAQELYKAYTSGDTAHAERVAARYKDAQTAATQFTAQVKVHYQSGDISREEAETLLKEFTGKDDDDIYWQIDKWDYTGDPEDYRKYGDLFEAVSSGVNLKATVNEYLDHGVTKQTLTSQITSQYKPLYKSMTRAERAAIKGYLMNAYSLLGYTRVEASKKIDAWLTDN